MFNPPKKEHFNLPKMARLISRKDKFQSTENCSIVYPKNDIFQSPENDTFQSFENGIFRSPEHDPFQSPKN